MSRTKTPSKTRLVDTIAGEELRNLRDLYWLIDDKEQTQALDGCIAEEYARYGDVHPDDQPHFRMLATVNIGYRLGLAMARELVRGVR